ncbi:hypothetical protein ACJJTC_006556, partial [Scirpophaga incertulas]
DDYAALALSQRTDEELAKARRDFSLKLEDIIIPGTNVTIVCDTSTGRPRPYLTPPFLPSDEPNNTVHPADFICDLRSYMSQLRPVSASHHSRQSIFVFKDLSESSHVWLRDDTVRRPLQAPYLGPYPIIRKGDKTLTININGREATVSIDRVKPAHFEALDSCDSKPGESTSSKISPPAQLLPEQHLPTPLPVTTRSGRKVKFRDVLDI